MNYRARCRIARGCRALGTCRCAFLLGRDSSWIGSVQSARVRKFYSGTAAVVHGVVGEKRMIETGHFDGLDTRLPKPRKKARLRPGDIVVIPLSDYLDERGYGLGLIWGSDGWSTACLWLFGPLLRQPPSLDEAVALIQPGNTLGPKTTGAQAIEHRGWRVLGQHPDFDQETWPAPTWGSERGRGSEIGYLRKFRFPPRKKAVFGHEEVDREVALSYPSHAGHGVVAVEIGLVRRLLTGVDPYLLRGDARTEALEAHKELIAIEAEGFRPLTQD